MQTCKPGSVSLRPSNMVIRILIIYLAPTSLSGSINLPISPFENRNMDEPPMAFTDETYLVFQHARFTLPLMSPAGRWALTPPFHLFPLKPRPRRVVCFLLHYLLSTKW